MIVFELAAASIRMSAPLLYASLGELLGEKAGVVNISLEGAMLVSAFAGTVATLACGNLWLGLAASVAAGMLFLAAFAALTVALACDQILVGTAMNLVAFGLTGLLYRERFGASGAALTLPIFPPVRVPLLADLPFVGPLLFEHNLLVYGAFLLVPAVHLALHATWPGLALRAAGEKPETLEAAGYSVRRVRAAALLAQGALAGVAGAYLALAHAGTFVEGLTAGRGFIALAIVVSGRWTAIGVLGVSGTSVAAQFHLQASDLGVPYQFVRMVPYILTLVVLAQVSRARSAAPAALGR
ncbi:MAG: ABC transporter permease [Candidatus Wallbacteria bacterium]|nr:ABC transporter permease [Candidatus Wallbacteria bacterium]